MDLMTLKIDPEKVRAARGGRSPTEVARAVGVSYTQLWNIESGKSRPSAEVLIRLCSLYGVELSTLTTAAEKILDAA